MDMSPDAKAKWDAMPQVARGMVEARASRIADESEDVSYEEAFESVMARVQVASVRPSHGTGH